MTDPAPPLFCIGALHWDIIGTAAAPLRAGDDVPGRVRRAPGGVAFNIAAALSRAWPGARPVLVSAVGDDADGAALIAACGAAGLDTAHVQRLPGTATDIYLAIESPDGLVAAVCDGETLVAGAALLAGTLGALLGAAPGAIVVADGNLPGDALVQIAGAAARAGADLRLASASAEKAGHLAAAFGQPGATFYLNLAEARALAAEDLPDTAAAASRLVELGAARAIVTDGPNPVALADGRGPRHLARPPRCTPRRVTGAGDALMAAHIAAEHTGLGPDAALGAALRAAARHIAPDDKDTAP